MLSALRAGLIWGRWLRREEWQSAIGGRRSGQRRPRKDNRPPRAANDVGETAVPRERLPTADLPAHPLHPFRRRPHPADVIVERLGLLGRPAGAAGPSFHHAPGILGVAPHAVEAR